MATTHLKRSNSDLAGEVTEGQRAMAAWMTAATGEVLTINTSLLANDHDLNRGMVQWAKVIAISAGCRF